MCYATHPRLALEQTAGGASRPHLWVLHAGREQYVASFAEHTTLVRWMA